MLAEPPNQVSPEAHAIYHGCRHLRVDLEKLIPVACQADLNEHFLVHVRLLRHGLLFAQWLVLGHFLPPRAH